MKNFKPEPKDTSAITLPDDLLDLSESEKEYDRMIAMETLKVIVGLGYGVEKKK